MQMLCVVGPRAAGYAQHLAKCGIWFGICQVIYVVKELCGCVPQGTAAAAAANVTMLLQPMVACFLGSMF
jgi:hypothetical protein